MNTSIVNAVKTGRYFAEQSPTLALFQAKLANTFRPHPVSGTSPTRVAESEPLSPSVGDSVRKQFQKWTKPSPISDCILWTGHRFHGHPVIGVGGKNMAAWRAIRIYVTGIPTLKDARHVRTCGFKDCVNPNHLTVR